METEFLTTDISTWEVGPFDAIVPGPIRLRAELDGEIIVACESETGFIHRGLEKQISRHPWSSSLVYADRLDPEAAVFGEHVFCLAVEEILGIEAPARAKGIRRIICELTRLSCHLRYMVNMARAVGSETVIHYLLRDRERILDLFELVTGGRFAPHYFRFGGVKEDVTEGFLERVNEVCDYIRIRIKEYNDILSFNYAFLRRLSNVGILQKAAVLQTGVTGPNARAAGVSMDLRKDEPYSGYEAIDFSVPVGSGEFGALGDTVDRYILRLREINQSIEIIRQTVEKLPSGPFNAMTSNHEPKIPEGEAYTRVEGPRGLLGCYLVSNGGPMPFRVHFRPASLANLAILPEVLVGNRVEDLPVILCSLDLSMAEVDR